MKKTMSTMKTGIKTLDESEQTSVELSLSSLTYPTFKPRSSIDPKTLINLSVNISQVGLLNPIIVKEISTDKWEVI